MAYNDSICGTPSVDCNTSHLSLEQIFRSLIKQDVNGCLFIPSNATGGGGGGTSVQTLVSATATKVKGSATTTYLADRPVYSDVANDAVFSIPLFTTSGKKAVITSGTYTFSDAVTPQLSGINGYVHLFTTPAAIPALVDSTDSLNLTYAQQLSYLGTLQMKSFEIENGANVVSGMIEPIGKEVIAYNTDSSSNVYAVVELTNNVELNAGNILAVQLSGVQW